MDFELVEHHPWITVGAIAGGGFLLFLVLRGRGSGGGSGQVVYAGGGSQVDPSIAASVQAQQDQIQGSISGLSIQGQTQIALAQIGAGVQSQTVSATQDVTNRQTDAQLQLGLGTLGAQVASEQIAAGVQMKTIDAIVAAFRGNNPIYNPTPTVSQPVWNATGNPITTNNAPDTVYVLPPSYNTGSNGGGIAWDSGYNVPRPNFATCDPRDVACVANNQAMDIQYSNNLLGAQTANNKAQCLANAQLSVGKPNYAALVAACG